jgi:hypothetical protein
MRNGLWNTMSRLNAPTTEDIPTETQAVLDGIGSRYRKLAAWCIDLSACAELPGS